MAHWLNCLLQQYESLALHPRYGYNNQSMETWACNWALVAWRELDPTAFWPASLVQIASSIFNEISSLKKNKVKNDRGRYPYQPLAFTWTSTQACMTHKKFFFFIRKEIQWVAEACHYLQHRSLWPCMISKGHLYSVQLSHEMKQDFITWNKWICEKAKYLTIKQLAYVCFTVSLNTQLFIFGELYPLKFG